MNPISENSRRRNYGPKDQIFYFTEVRGGDGKRMNSWQTVLRNCQKGAGGI